MWSTKLMLLAHGTAFDIAKLEIMNLGGTWNAFGVLWELAPRYIKEH